MARNYSVMGKYQDRPNMPIGVTPNGVRLEVQRCVE
jgi:hypothetical protein